MLDPSLLIADEITSALDVSSQRAVGELLVEFRDRGFVKSMIVITHDLAILYQVADTILVMYAGQARGEGARGDDRQRAAPSVHAPPDLLASGSRRPLRRDPACRDPRQAALAARRRRPAADSATAVRSHSRSARRRLPSSRSSRGTRSHAGGLQPDARARRRLEGLQGRHLRREASARSGRRQLPGRPRRGRLTDRREREREEHDRPAGPRALARDGGDNHLRGARGLATREESRARTTPTCRASSRTRSARTTRSSKPTGC